MNTMNSCNDYEHYFSVLHKIPIGVFILDRNLNILHWNHTMTDWFQKREESVLSKPLAEIFPQFSSPRYTTRLKDSCRGSASIILSPQLHAGLYRYINNAGETVDNKIFHTIITFIADPESDPELSCLTLFTLQDVTDLSVQINRFREMKDKAYAEVKQRQLVEAQLREMNEFLDHTSKTDPLTGTLNRREIVNRLEEEVARSDRSKSPFSLILCDIDDFKKFNDNFGHDCGDHILKSVTAIMRENIRLQDSLGRWGGEEFIIVLPDTELTGAVEAAEKLRAAINKSQFTFQETSHTVTLTYGVRQFEIGASNATDCIKAADDGLLAGKREGKNCVKAIKQP